MFDFLIPIAHATSLDQIGAGIGGLSSMWGGIAIYMAHPGEQGILVMTGIVISTVLWMIGSAATLVILYASVRIITSGGNDETVRKAWKEMIFYACLGLILAILSETILQYVIDLAGFIAES